MNLRDVAAGRVLLASRESMNPWHGKILKDFVTIWTTVDPISNVAMFAG